MIKKSWKAPKSSKILVTQKIPGGKIYLVPNPEIMISKRGLIGPSDTAKVTFDALNRKSSGSMSLYTGKDKEYKLGLSFDSKKVRLY